jgi:hypothetical protein
VTKKRIILPKTRTHRDKIALSEKGKKVSKETKSKIAEAATGRVFPEEVKKKISESVNATKGMNDEQRHRFTYERDWRADHERMANMQMEEDLRTCAEMKDANLYKDVKKSRGYRQMRRVWDPTGRVSDGFYYGRIWWPLVAEKDVPSDGKP